MTTVGLLETQGPESLPYQTGHIQVILQYMDSIGGSQTP